jgi:hypothetical protein
LPSAELASGRATRAPYCLLSPLHYVWLMMLMLAGKATRVETLLARQSRPTRGRVPPWPPPSSLTTAIASISGTPRCAQLTWTCQYMWPRRSHHRWPATAIALLPSPVPSLTIRVRVSVAARGREPDHGPGTPSGPHRLLGLRWRMSVTPWLTDRGGFPGPAQYRVVVVRVPNPFCFILFQDFWVQLWKYVTQVW